MVIFSKKKSIVEATVKATVDNAMGKYEDTLKFKQKEISK